MVSGVFVELGEIGVDTLMGLGLGGKFMGLVFGEFKEPNSIASFDVKLSRNGNWISGGEPSCLSLHPILHFHKKLRCC